jgi:hypothetical protein
VRNQRLWRVSLVAAGVLEFGMVMAHFGLQYEWTGFDFGPLPRQLAWALLALNFSWTVLLLAIVGLVLYAARIGPTNRFARKFVFIVGLFWAIHGAYVWLVPMALPERLAWLQFVLGAFPATLIALHWIPLVACRPARAESSPIAIGHRL